MAMIPASCDTFPKDIAIYVQPVYAPLREFSACRVDAVHLIWGAPLCGGCIIVANFGPHLSTTWSFSNLVCLGNYGGAAQYERGHSIVFFQDSPAAMVMAKDSPECDERLDLCFFDALQRCAPRAWHRDVTWTSNGVKNGKESEADAAEATVDHTRITTNKSEEW
eukprot:scaffold14974_cov195-Amphora_coffeaeformis.AAC.25